MKDCIIKDLRDFPKLIFLSKYLTGHKGYIAGGCFKNILNGEKCKDIDILFKNEPEFRKAVEHFRCKTGFDSYYENDNVIAFKDLDNGLVIELCRKTYSTPFNMLDQFDFTITKFAAYDDRIQNPNAYANVDEGEFCLKVAYSPRFFEDLYMKRLYVDNQMKYPMSTYNRAFKYARYGYFPCRETKRRIAEEINYLDEEEIFEDKAFYDGID